MTIATATEVQNNFGKYMKYVEDGQEIVILKNGREIARIVPKEKTMSFLTDSLVGILSGDIDEKAARAERLKKYESAD